MFPFGGVVSVRVLAPEHGGCGEGPQRPTSLCSMSSAWVVEPGRINTADEIADALVNETVNVAPYPSTEDESAPITGRFTIGRSLASNKYGGA